MCKTWVVLWYIVFTCVECVCPASVFSSTIRQSLWHAQCSEWRLRLRLCVVCFDSWRRNKKINTATKGKHRKTKPQLALSLLDLLEICQADGPPKAFVSTFWGYVKRWHALAMLTYLSHFIALGTGTWSRSNRDASCEVCIGVTLTRLNYQISLSWPSKDWWLVTEHAESDCLFLPFRCVSMYRPC